MVQFPHSQGITYIYPPERINMSLFDKSVREVFAQDLNSTAGDDSIIFGPPNGLVFKLIKEPNQPSALETLSDNVHKVIGSFLPVSSIFKMYIENGVYRHTVIVSERVVPILSFLDTVKADPSIEPNIYKDLVLKVAKQALHLHFHLLSKGIIADTDLCNLGLTKDGEIVLYDFEGISELEKVSLIKRPYAPSSFCNLRTEYANKPVDKAFCDRSHAERSQLIIGRFCSLVREQAGNRWYDFSTEIDRYVGFCLDNREISPPKVRDIKSLPPRYELQYDQTCLAEQFIKFLMTHIEFDPNVLSVNMVITPAEDSRSGDQARSFPIVNPHFRLKVDRVRQSPERNSTSRVPGHIPIGATRRKKEKKHLLLKRLFSLQIKSFGKLSKYQLKASKK